MEARTQRAHWGRRRRKSSFHSIEFFLRDDRVFLVESCGRGRGEKGGKKLREHRESWESEFRSAAPKAVATWAGNSASSWAFSFRMGWNQAHNITRSAYNLGQLSLPMQRVSLLSFFFFFFFFFDMAMQRKSYWFFQQWRLLSKENPIWNPRKEKKKRINPLYKKKRKINRFGLACGGDAPAGCHVLRTRRNSVTRTPLTWQPAVSCARLQQTQYSLSTVVYVLILFLLRHRTVDFICLKERGFSKSKITTRSSWKMEKRTRPNFAGEQREIRFSLSCSLPCQDVGPA